MQARLSRPARDISKAREIRTPALPQIKGDPAEKSPGEGRMFATTAFLRDHQGIKHRPQRLQRAPSSPAKLRHRPIGQH